MQGNQAHPSHFASSIRDDSPPRTLYQARTVPDTVSQDRKLDTRKHTHSLNLVPQLGAPVPRLLDKGKGVGGGGSGQCYKVV